MKTSLGGAYGPITKGLRNTFADYLLEYMMVIVNIHDMMLNLLLSPG